MPAYKYVVLYHTKKLSKQEASVQRSWLEEANGFYTRDRREHVSDIETEDRLTTISVTVIEKPLRLELKVWVELIDHPTDTRSPSDRRDILLDFFEDFFEEHLGSLPICQFSIEDQSLVPA